MLELLFPTYCINCQRPGNYICMKCRKKLKNSLPECYICRRVSTQYLTHKQCRKNNLEAVFIGWRYDDIAKKILSQFKYRYAYKISKILANLLVDRLRKTGFLDLITEEHVLMPIPSHISHTRKRGYNQSSLIAEELSRRVGIPILKESLVRDKDKRYQSTMSSTKRAELGKVFSINRKLPKEKIVLIDDVVTTGTTLNRAALALNKKDVKAIALFRGRPRYSQ